MNTKSLIDLIEYLTDRWPGETIDVDTLAEIIHETLRDACLKSFIQDYGGCCLACAIDHYFETSEKYQLVVKFDAAVSSHCLAGNC